MRPAYYLLPAALLLLLPTTGFAQFITDPTQALAARDSLLNQVAVVRQQIELQSRRLVTKAPKAGARRLVVRGYYAPAPGTKSVPALAWRHVVKHYRNGSSRELYMAYLQGKKVTVQERRHNGILTWLDLENYLPFNQNVLPTFRLSGTFTVSSYLRWNGKNYLLPARLPKP